MDVEARMADDPTLDECGFMGGIVIHDQVHVKILGYVGVDGVEELTKLQGTMSALKFADHISCRDVKGCDRLVVPWRR